MKSLFPVPKGVEGGRPVNLIFWFSMDLMIYETQQVLLLNPEEAPPILLSVSWKCQFIELPNDFHLTIMIAYKKTPDKLPFPSSACHCLTPQGSVVYYSHLNKRKESL